MTDVATCLWFEKDGEAAARFYTALIPGSEVTEVFHAPGDYPAGITGDALVVNFTLAGRPSMILNGGVGHPQTDAASISVTCEDQAEVDRYWAALIADGGAEIACGWCRDRWGVNWQITPRVLTDALAQGGDVAKRAFEAMMTMRKIDVAAIEAAARG